MSDQPPATEAVIDDALAASNVFAAINRLGEYLDEHNGTGRSEMTMQILKITEEAGEAAAAWIGATGQNPRKGVTHTMGEVEEELADVAITALVGIARLGGDPLTALHGKAAVMTQRYAEVGGCDD